MSSASDITGQNALTNTSPLLQTLLAGLVDYAGLFPPASLTMCAAAATYATEQQGRYADILGRFIVPTARLAEFKDLLQQFEQRSNIHWRLSVLIGPELENDLEKITAFQAQHAEDKPGPRVQIESVEWKAANLGKIHEAARTIPKALEAYIEIPISNALEDSLAAIRQAGFRAKVRTGGETALMFPSCADLACFMHACAQAQIGFKATAGLHHPIRSKHPFTYEQDSPSGMMHGFLNVFLAAAFTQRGMGAPEIEQLLGEESSQAFQVDSTAITWRTHRLSKEDILSARRQFATSFGSCSFREPIDDLKALHLL